MAPSPVQRSAFEAMVAQALDDLPDEFRDAMDNVEVVVEDWPDAETMQRAGVGHPSQLLGFYHGVPLTRRGSNYSLVLPDKISIYRMPILMRCRTADEVRELVGHVVRHEVAHHFGIDDDRLREIGAH
jgi:predicted Zn-dependent protease with MMP-like domain